MAKPACGVIMIGAGVDLNSDWIDSSRSENANPSGSNEKAGNALLSRVDQVEVRDR